MIRVHSIETLGTQDGPGVRMVVFVQGCQFCCLYCHNPDTQEVGGGQLYSIEQILEKLERQRNYLVGGGLTVSGGEPMLQATEINELFKAVKNAGFEVALDTNGGIMNQHTQELLLNTDLLLLDIKHINENEHIKLTGASNQTTLKTADFWEVNKKRGLWLRYVLVPGINDQEEYLERWGERFADFKSLERVELLPYHELGVEKYRKLNRPYLLRDVKPPTNKVIQRAAQILRCYFGEKVVIK